MALRKKSTEHLTTADNCRNEARYLRSAEFTKGGANSVAYSRVLAVSLAYSRALASKFEDAATELEAFYLVHKIKSVEPEPSAIAELETIRAFVVKRPRMFVASAKIEELIDERLESLRGIRRARS